jgi:hypothetical protein
MLVIRCRPLVTPCQHSPPQHPAPRANAPTDKYTSAMLQLWVLCVPLLERPSMRCDLCDWGCSEAACCASCSPTPTSIIRFVGAGELLWVYLALI